MSDINSIVIWKSELWICSEIIVTPLTNDDNIPVYIKQANTFLAILVKLSIILKDFFFLICSQNFKLSLGFNVFLMDAI